MNLVLAKDEEGDWEGLYINGKLWDENHSLSLSAVLLELTTKTESIDQFRVFWVNADWLHDVGRLPLQFEDLAEHGVWA